jgi:hypothetical protein
MSPLLLFGIAIVVIYLSECVVWTRRGAAVVTAPLVGLFGRLGRHLPRSFGAPPAALGTPAGAFTPLMPLPPFGRVFIVEAWPFSMTTTHVLAATSGSIGKASRAKMTGTCVAWVDVKTITVDDKAIRINGQPFCDTSSNRHVKNASRVLRAVHAAPESERQALIDTELAAHFDVVRTQRLVMTEGKKTLSMLMVNTILFAVLFGWVPFVVNRIGLTKWQHLIGGVYSFVVLGAALFYVAHRSLMPKDRGDRWLNTLLALPTPTLTMRSIDKLSRHLLSDQHPLAAAAAIFAGKNDMTQVGELFRDLDHPRRPVLPTQDDTALAVDVTFRAAQRRCASAELQRAGIDVAALVAAPTLPKGFTWFCLRCHDAYRDNIATGCASCGGVPLAQKKEQS